MKTDPRKNLNDYARYSSMAFQMLAIILAGVFGGVKADEWLGTSPLLTVILSMAAVIMAIYFVTKDLLKK
jgi:hypothetical protein